MPSEFAAYDEHLNPRRLSTSAICKAFQVSPGALGIGPETSVGKEVRRVFRSAFPSDVDLAKSVVTHASD